MGKLSELIDEAADAKNPLRDAMLKSKVLAYSLRGRKFRDWLELESNGCGDRPVPEYRRLRSDIVGYYDGWGGAFEHNVPIPTTHLPKNMREVFEWYPVNPLCWSPDATSLVPALWRGVSCSLIAIVSRQVQENLSRRVQEKRRHRAGREGLPQRIH